MQAAPGLQYRTLFTYPIHFGAPLAASGELSTSFIVRKNEGFLWYGARATVYQGDTEPNTFADLIQQAQLVPPITVMLQDTVSGEQLMNIPAPLGSVFGLGLMPIWQNTPRYLDETTQLAITLQNVDTVNDYIVRLAFVGQAIYASGV